MTDLNMITVHGRIVRNADFTVTDSGVTVARFTLASNKVWKNQSGEWINETTFIPLVLFDNRASGIGPYLKKGRGVTVQGHLRQYRWEKDGEKRSELQVAADRLLLDPDVKKTEETGQSDCEGYEKLLPDDTGLEFDFPPSEVGESFESFQ